MSMSRSAFRPSRRRSPAFHQGLRLEQLETRIVPSYADGNGAVITAVTEQNNGTELVITFDGPLNPSPTNPAQQPTNTANYSIQVPTANAQIVTSSLSTVAVTQATYDNAAQQVTLQLGSALAPGTSYRLLINGIGNADPLATPGLVDAKNNPIDGDYDDTISGNFYALFAWTTAGTPIAYNDFQGDQVSLTISGPGQLNAWRELNGDFAAGNLAQQANLQNGLFVQQLNVANGVQGQTVLSGSATFAPGSNGVVVVPPTIPGIFTNDLPAYFQSTAPAPAPSPSPVIATANNLPYTIQVQQVDFPNLPVLMSAVAGQDNVEGSPFNGYWLLFGGRNNGLHNFVGGSNNNFPTERQNTNIYVIDPSTGRLWTRAWQDTDVPAALTPPLYSTNQEFYQQGDTLFTIGGYGDPATTGTPGDNGVADFTTYSTLTALSVSGLIAAVVNGGSIAGPSQLQQITDVHFQVTGGELSILNGQALLVVGHDFQGEYIGKVNPTQTYSDEIRTFQIAYNGAVPNSLAISNYQAQNDQVNFRRRDYDLADVILPNGQPALNVFGGVFSPSPPADQLAAGYRFPIQITGFGQTQLGSYQQFFNQYSAPHLGLFSPSTKTMNTIFLGGISLSDVNFAVGQFSYNLVNGPPVVPGLPWVNDVTSLVQFADGSAQEFEIPSQLPGLLGAESRLFAAGGLTQFANGVINLDQIQQPTTLGYIYGGIVSDNGQPSYTQTAATNAVFRITLIPNAGPATNTKEVDSLYQVPLGRPADPSGQSYWVAKLDSGTPATQVAYDFVTSPEGRSLQIDHFYQYFLQRAPESAGKAFFLREFAQGFTDQQVITQFLSSSEFLSVQPSTSNTDFVTGLYLVLLNRAPDSQGSAYWVGQLNSGASPTAVINAFQTSAEYYTLLVDNFYLNYLGRMADAGGQNYWVNVLASQPSEVVMAGFLGSAEYFNNHPGVA
jgi:hypothetical protein